VAKTIAAVAKKEQNAKAKLADDKAEKLRKAKQAKRA
jgi:hypothetical protein